MRTISCLLATMLYCSFLTSAQNWLWVHADGGDQYGGAIRMNEGKAICADNEGNVYAVGSFSGKATLGRDTLNAYSYINPVLVKHDKDGAVLWAKKLATGATDFANGVCVDNLGNVCVTGDKSGSAIRSFIAKYDKNGKLLWEYNVKGTGCHTTSRAVCTDGSGNFYVAGDCKGIVYFDNIHIGEKDKYTIFLVKYSAAGKMIWINASKPSEYYDNQAKCMCYDSNGHIFIGGKYTGTAQFDTRQISSKGAADAFIACYNTNGKITSLWSYGSPGNDCIESMVTDNHDGLLATAYFASEYQERGKELLGENLLNLTSTGVLVWNTQVGVGTREFLVSSYVTRDPWGSIYLTGNYYYAVPLFGAAKGENQGASDMFVAKCSPQGKKIWVATLGNKGVDEGNAICTDKTGNIFITGYYHGNVNFGNRFLLLSPSQDDGMFVAKLK